MPSEDFHWHVKDLQIKHDQDAPGSYLLFAYGMNSVGSPATLLICEGPYAECERVRDTIAKAANRG